MKTLIIFVMCLLLAACQSAPKKQGIIDRDMLIEHGEELKVMAEGVVGHELSEKDVKRLANDLRHNEEAKQALESITESVSGGNVGIKYSPVTGKRYSATLEYEPETGVKLLPLEE